MNFITGSQSECDCTVELSADDGSIIVESAQTAQHSKFDFEYEIVMVDAKYFNDPQPERTITVTVEINPDPALLEA